MATIEVQLDIGPSSIYYKAHNVERASGASLGTVSAATGKLKDADGSYVSGADATLTDDGNGNWDGSSNSPVTLTEGEWYRAEIVIELSDGTKRTGRSDWAKART